MNDKLISFKKIEFEGSNAIRKEEYYTVADVKITIREEKEVDYSEDDIDVEDPNFINKMNYWCTCKSCSIKSIPRGEDSSCVFVRSLKAYIKLKRHKGGIRF